MRPFLDLLDSFQHLLSKAIFVKNFRILVCTFFLWVCDVDKFSNFSVCFNSVKKSERHWSQVLPKIEYSVNLRQISLVLTNLKEILRFVFDFADYFIILDLITRFADIFFHRTV